MVTASMKGVKFSNGQIIDRLVIRHYKLQIAKL